MQGGFGARSKTPVRMFFFKGIEQFTKGFLAAFRRQGKEGLAADSKAEAFLGRTPHRAFINSGRFESCRLSAA